jgi:hypothetical protein
MVHASGSSQIGLARKKEKLFATLTTFDQPIDHLARCRPAVDMVPKNTWMRRFGRTRASWWSIVAKTFVSCSAPP